MLESRAVDRRAFGSYLCRIDAGAEPSDDASQPEVVLGQRVGTVELWRRRGQRHPHVRHVEVDAGKVLRCDADHGVAAPSQLERAAEHGSVLAESTLPELSADYGDMGGIPQAVLVGAEEAPQQRADAEEGEEGRRDQLTLDPLRLRAEPETETAVPIRGDGRQAARVVAEVGVTRIGPDHRSEGSVSLPGRHVNSHDSIRIGHVRRRPEEQPVHHAEHRGVRPDAEPQRQHGRER